jgi:hypothetical protein
MLLSRENHCLLSDLHVEAFKTLQRYGRLPALPAQFQGKKGFSPIETLALATANAMVTACHISWEQAAAICSEVRVIADHWHDIGKISAMLGRQDGGILFGRAMLPGVSPPVTVYGTLAEIAEDNPAAICIDAISISRVAATIRNRARDNSIDISDFWAGPVEAQPSAVPDRRRKRIWKRKK